MVSTLLHTVDREYELLHALSGYLAAVGAAFGVGEESMTLDVDMPMSAYIALDGRLAQRPDRDTALLWDERHGWAFAMETHSGEDLLVLAYLGGEIVPGPRRVADFVAAIRSLGRPTSAPVPPDVHSDAEDVVARLACYRAEWTIGAKGLSQSV